MSNIIDFKTKKSVIVEHFASYPKDETLKLIHYCIQWWFKTDLVITMIEPDINHPKIFILPYDGNEYEGYKMFNKLKWFWITRIMRRSYESSPKTRFYKWLNRIQDYTKCNIIVLRCHNEPRLITLISKYMQKRQD